MNEDIFNTARPVSERNSGILKQVFRLDRGRVMFRGTEDTPSHAAKPHISGSGRRAVMFRTGPRRHRIFLDTLKVFLAHGVWDSFPEHIDGKLGNDGLSNLRFTQSVERQKRTSGAYRNPHSDGLDNAWRSQISVKTASGDHTEVHLGTFATREEAHAAYIGAQAFQAASVASLGFTVNRRGRKILVTSNASGYAGVAFDAQKNKYVVMSRRTETDNDPRYVGKWDTAHEAFAGYIQWLRVNGNDETKELIRSGLL